MSRSRENLSIADVYEFRSGLSKPRSAFGTGAPFLSFKDVFYNSAVPDLLEELVESSEKEKQNCSVRRGDVFLTRTSETVDELGMSCVALRDIPDATFNGFCKRLRPKASGQIVPEYARYFFRSNRFRDQVNAMATMSTRASLNNEMLDRLKIDVPSIVEQHAIGEILGNLDDKIELNQKMNQTLEEIAKAIFKSWFVDFDPVRAKMEERPTGLPPEIDELFPDELVDSEIGQIPRGWVASSLGDLVIPKKGKSITKKTVVEGSVPVVAGGLSPAYYHNTSNVKAPLVTVSASGANAGFARLYNEDIWASDCSYISEEQTPFVFLWYVFLKIQQQKIYHMQQGAAQPHIYPSDLMRLQLAYPESDELWCSALDLISPMFLRIGNSEKEIGVLSSLRDTILPKLISGELQIPDAEKFLEEAGI